MSKTRVASLWTRSAKTQEQKEELRLNLAAAEPIMQILDSFVEAKLDRAERGDADYNDAAWAYKAADLNGYRRALEEMRDLIHNRNV